MAGAERPWSTWRPADSEPWNVRRVVHLHRRAGFGATWNEIERDLRDGPRAAIDRLLQGQSRIDAQPEDFAQMADVIGAAAVGSNNPNRLKAWWIYRMLFTPDPLAEKLALMWHNHFATSNLKVDDLARMRAQNDIFRQLGRAPFGELLKAVVHDPAMLVWLDADSNRQGAANENLAREIMELFTLGIGNYGEQDIKEGARALTGWTVRDNAFFHNEKLHDAGEKTILGRTGRWQGQDFVRILLDQEATSRRLAWRICQTFFGEGAVEDEAVAELAKGLRQHDLDIGWAVETVLKSAAFYSDRNIGTRVSEPIEFLVGSARALESFAPPPSTVLLAEWSARLGQDLFCPPNVGGWSGGRDWLASQYIVARANYAAALTEGRLSAAATPIDLAGLSRRHGCQENLDEAINWFDQLLLGGRLSDPSRQRVFSAVAEKSGEYGEQLCWIVALMMALPESQLN